jgi:hypothetical protein
MPHLCNQNTYQLLNFIKLEIGPRSSRVPCKYAQVSSYAAQEYPNVFKINSFSVRVILSERTFWEKATILHQIASSSDDKPIASRFSRHYYDIYQMNRSIVKTNSLNDIGLLIDVADFKSRFYRSPAAKYV